MVANDIPEKHATRINTDGGVRMCNVAHSAFSPEFRKHPYRRRLPDTTQLLFHYNNIKSSHCAGWRCGTMPPLTEPTAAMQNTLFRAHISTPKKLLVYRFRTDRKTLLPIPPQHRCVASQIASQIVFRNVSGLLPHKVRLLYRHYTPHCCLQTDSQVLKS